MSFAARVDGACGLCDVRIQEGDTVDFCDDEVCHVACIARELGDEEPDEEEGG